MMKNRVKRQGGVCVRLLPGIVLICFAALLLGGCGKVRSPKLLARQAKSTYGPCTVVSTTQTDKMTKVVLRDKLQDFEYSIWSQMSEIWVDGTLITTRKTAADLRGIPTIRRKLCEKGITEVVPF